MRRSCLIGEDVREALETIDLVGVEDGASSRLERGEAVGPLYAYNPDETV
jgi:hypothetical protein